MKRLSLGLSLLFPLLALAAPLDGAPGREAADKERVLDLTGKLVCTCGCANIIVRYCDCGQAAEMTKEVAAMVAADKSDDDIYSAFEKKYGKKVRGAPKPEGFNMLAWVLPFVGLALGGVIVAVVVRRLRTPVEESGPPQTDEQVIEDRYRELLDRELEE